MRTVTRPLLLAFGALVAALALSLAAGANAPAQAQYGGCSPYYSAVGPAPVVSMYPMGCTVDVSIDTLVDQHVQQMVTNGLLTRILLGGTEQINCTNCVSGFGAVGSGSAGIHGRYNINSRLSVLGGLSINEYRSGGVVANQALIGAMSLRYDFTDWGRSRPFFEIGGSGSPNSRSRFDRDYTDGFNGFRGIGKAGMQNWSIFARAGWVWRVTPRDEFAVYGDLGRQWQVTHGYTEAVTALNPAPATFLPGTDMMNVAKLVVQHTHLFGSSIEVGGSIALAQSFGSVSGVKADVPGFGFFRPGANEATWFEYMARVGYRIRKGVVVDAFVLGTAGEKPVGNTLHGGMGLRLSF